MFDIRRCRPRFVGKLHVSYILNHLLWQKGFSIIQQTLITCPEEQGAFMIELASYRHFFGNNMFKIKVATRMISHEDILADEKSLTEP